MIPGFIKLHRKMLEWEWYDDHNTCRLFNHLLIIANYKETRWKKELLKPGQLATGRKSLAIQIGLSEQQIRTALKKLESTHEITIKPRNKYSIISITNWATYQTEPVIPNQQKTTAKEYNNIINSISSDMLPEFIPKDLWEKFVENREKNGTPLSALAATRSLSKLKRLYDGGYDLKKVMQDTVDNMWRGFFEKEHHKLKIKNPKLKRRSNAANTMDHFKHMEDDLKDSENAFFESIIEVNGEILD